MLSWKKIAGAVVVLAVAVVVAGVAVLKSIDFNEYKGLIAEQAKAATGRELVIAGNLKLEVSLHPAVAVEGVSFANAPWGTRPEMVKLERMAAEVELLPLLAGDVRVKRLVLEGLDLLAETDKRGRGNWELTGTAGMAAAGGAEAAPDTESPARLPEVNSVRIKDLTVTYLDGISGKRTRLRLERLDIQAADAASPVALDLAGDFDGKPVHATGWIGPLKTLVQGDAPYAFELQASALGAEVSLKGSAKKPRALEGLDVAVRAKGAELGDTLAAVKDRVAALKGVDVPAVGAFDVRLTAKGSAQALSLSDIEAKVDKPEQGVVTVTGAIKDALGASGLDLAVAAEGKDVGPLARAFGAQIPRLPPFTIKARLSDLKGGYRLDGLAATLGTSDIAGALTVRLSGVTRPTLEAALTSELLDLDALLPRRAPPPPGPRKDRVFSREPLALDAMKAADVRLDLSFRQVVAGGIKVEDVKARVVLGAGRLDVRPLAARLSGGTVKADLVVDGSKPVPALTLNLDARDVDYGALFRHLDLTDIASGTVDAKANLKGRGGSVAALMAGLDGGIRVVTEGGTIESGLLNVLSADVSAALPFVSSSGDKDIRCGVVDLDVRKGRAQAKTLVFETGGISLIGTGAINLADETIDMNIEPRAKKISVLKLASVPVDVGGTLASPTVVPDVAGTAVGAVTGAVSTAKDLAKDLAKGGVGALGRIVGLGGDDKAKTPAEKRAKAIDDTDYCKLALAGRAVRPAAPKAEPAEAGDAAGEPAAEPAKAPAPAPTTQDKIDKKLDTIGKDVGGALKGLFGK